MHIKISKYFYVLKNIWKWDKVYFAKNISIIFISVFMLLALFILS